ncbi:hypothetical protein [Variovorax boronicumulans]|uniref:hypothetical protein n=1 Tax=Variovorax boronicumulans TaxID=436515 RepID=UPI000AD251B3|nr:hypothetical protein [Variovorax boronicumulans]
MIFSFSDHFQVDAGAIEAAGALDPILGIDTRLFLDPRLLHSTETPELAGSSEKVRAHFEAVLKLVLRTQKNDDVFWRRADRMLTFPEVRGLCIGYSSGSTAGRGMGPQKRARLLETTMRIVQAGVEDSDMFELAGIFEGGIGPDLISDMIAKIIMEDLIAFTQRVCSDLGVPMEPLRVSPQHPLEDLPRNPVSAQPIILVPMDVLSQLPIADSFLDIGWVASFNDQLREELNKVLGSDWRDLSTGDKKHGLREAFVASPDGLRAVLSKYRELDAEPYDFKDDPAGEVSWYPAAKAAVANNALALKLRPGATVDEVYEVVQTICEHYAFLLGERQLCKLLYNKDGSLKHESAAQLLFVGIASAYCEANGLDLSPESDAGRGPVDFKISSGFNGIVLVEVKFTSNSQLIHGFEKQLPIYMQAEKATKGVYLVIDVGRISDDRMNTFRKIVATASPHAPRVMYADGIPRPSASKA